MAAGATQDKLRRWHLTAEDASPEIKCDACNGRGSPAVQTSANRRTYFATCKKCGGKGRIRKPA
jgi:DnaJ-class molecular chaperone